MCVESWSGIMTAYSKNSCENLAKFSEKITRNSNISRHHFYIWCFASVSYTGRKPRCDSLLRRPLADPKTSGQALSPPQSDPVSHKGKKARKTPPADSSQGKKDPSCSLLPGLFAHQNPILPCLSLLPWLQLSPARTFTADIPRNESRLRQLEGADVFPNLKVNQWKLFFPHRNSVICFYWVLQCQVMLQAYDELKGFWWTGLMTRY